MKITIDLDEEDFGRAVEAAIAKAVNKIVTPTLVSQRVEELLFEALGGRFVGERKLAIKNIVAEQARTLILEVTNHG